MSRFADSNNKLGRFLARNEGTLLKGALREIIAKAYRSPKVRALSRKIYSPREPQKWVFLVGCYNSGTTILRRLLESHPEIAAFPMEGVEMTDAFADMEAGGWPRMMYANRAHWGMPEEGSAARADMAKRDWARWWPKSASVFLEKSIDHTVRMPWLDRHFPNAYFIFIVRNGYCVCEGIQRRAAPQDDAAKSLGAKYPMSMIAEQWIAINERAEKDGLDVKRFHKVRYEDLVDNPDSILGDLFEFLELDIPEITHSGDSIVLNGQKHQLLNQNEASIYRLCSDDKNTLSKILAPELIRQGYEVLREV